MNCHNARVSDLGSAPRVPAAGIREDSETPVYGAWLAYAVAPPGELRNAIADPSAIRRALGWMARRVPLDYADVVEFWRANAG